MSRELQNLRALHHRVRRTDSVQLEDELLHLQKEVKELSLAYQALVRRQTWAWTRAEQLAEQEAFQPQIVSFLQTHNTDPELWKKLES
jgi:hypothetical protein